MAITRHHWFAITSAFLTLGVAACANDSGSSTADSKPPPPGVSFLDYSPKPFTKDMDEMTVKFAISGPASDYHPLSGRDYSVQVLTGEDNRDKDCAGEFGSYGEVWGKPGKSYAVVIQMTAEGTTDYDEGHSYHACLGRAKIVVVADRCCPRKVMRTLPFRVLPPRS